MARLISNTFTTWELTPEEELEGTILTTLQLQCIQNLLSTGAESKLALTMDPTNLTDYAVQEAFWRGQLDILAHIIACSETSSSLRDNPVEVLDI